MGGTVRDAASPSYICPHLSLIYILLYQRRCFFSFLLLLRQPFFFCPFVWIALSLRLSRLATAFRGPPWPHVIAEEVRSFDLFYKDALVTRGKAALQQYEAQEEEDGEACSSSKS